MRKQIWIFIILVALAVGSLIFLGRNKEEKISANQVEIAGTIIKVEIADTPKLRMQGLSLHKPLADDEGMLFIFDEPAIHSFWMKDMLFPIDIIWFTPSGVEGLYKIIDITHDAQPESFPETFSPKIPAQYVLEVNAGLARKNNWQAGDEVKFK